MNKEKLHAIAQGLMDIATKNLIRDGELFPVAFVVRPGGVMEIGPVPMGSDRDKDVTSDMLKVFVRAGAKAVGLITEAWTVSLSDPTDEATEAYRTGRKRARTDPLRKEAIVITAACRDGDLSLMGVFERGPDGTPLPPTKVESVWSGFDGARIEGRFANFFHELN